MNIKKLIIPVLVALMSAIISFSGVAQAGPPGGADYALFDSRDNDEYVTCSCRSKCELNIAVTNLEGAALDGIQIKFRDDSDIALLVPKGDSRSFTQYLGTERRVDDEVVISPLGSNDMLMWISIKGPSARCDVYNPTL